MLTTYTVYLRRGAVARWAFEPLMCRADDLMDRVRKILQRHPDCEAADVYLGETELFQVKQPPKTARG